MKKYGERIRYDSGLDRLIKVSRVLVNGEWRPFPAVSTNLMAVWSSLQSIEILNPNDEDTVVWTATSGGTFSTKSAWDLIGEKGTTTPWSDVIWYNNNILKHSCFAWRVLNKKIPTQSWLCKLRILSYSQCFFCWNARETQEHLYFECPFTKAIWEQLLR